MLQSWISHVVKHLSMSEYIALSIYTNYDYLLYEFKHKGWGRKETKNRGVKKRVRRKGGGGEIREKEERENRSRRRGGGEGTTLL